MSETSTLEISVAAKSDAGLKREENQDRMSRFYSPFGEVFLVTDGMGGHRGGARAASLVGDGFARHLKALAPDTPVELAIRMAAEKTNTEVVGESRSGEPETAGMGATLVLAILRGNDAVIAHVGDSRAYLYRNGNLLALTRDHTRGQEKVNVGLLTDEEAWDHPESSILTRAFGHSDPLTIDISAPISLKPGDQILLCSDGLCGYVRDPIIAEVLSHGFGAKRTAEKLVQLANEAGGEDNVTVQMILVGDEPHDRIPAPTEVEKGANAGASPLTGGIGKPPTRILVLLVAIVLLAVVAWGGYALFKRMTLVSRRTNSQSVSGVTAGGGPAAPAVIGLRTNADTPNPSRAANNDKSPVVLLLGDDKDKSIQKMLGEKAEVVATIPQALSRLPPSVIVYAEHTAPSLVSFATKIHAALAAKYPDLIVILRPMQENEKKQIHPKGSMVVVIGQQPKPPPPTHAGTSQKEQKTADKQDKPAALPSEAKKPLVDREN